MTDDELDEAILGLSESERDDLWTDALYYCLDQDAYWKANEYKKTVMHRATMRMMMRERNEDTTPVFVSLP